MLSVCPILCLCCLKLLLFMSINMQVNSSYPYWTMFNDNVDIWKKLLKPWKRGCSISILTVYVYLQDTQHILGIYFNLFDRSLKHNDNFFFQHLDVYWFLIFNIFLIWDNSPFLLSRWRSQCFTYNCDI